MVRSMAEPTVPTTDDPVTILRWLEAEFARPFTGWDFSHLAERMEEAATPWDYRRLVAAALPTATAMLDMGTGGGEFLASLGPVPPVAMATEGYAPNLPIARDRLEPLGVRVVAVEEDSALPFGDALFDLVVNRHESYDPNEVRRVLRPGGRFLTQQVGGTNDRDLNRLLGAPGGDDFAGWDLAAARAGLVAAGLTVVTAEEAFPASRFRDAGAVVAYLKSVPWQVPDFSVSRYAERLLALHRRIVAEGPLAVGGHRFLLVAEQRPPAAPSPTGRPIPARSGRALSPPA